MYDQEYWLACFDSLNSTIFNSSAAALPPFAHQRMAINENDKKLNLGQERGENTGDPGVPKGQQDISPNNRNDEYFAFQNFYEFRQARSDHVMGRLRVHFRFDGLSMRRLQSGHYIMHQSTPAGPIFDLAENKSKTYGTEDWIRKRRAVMAQFGSEVAMPKFRSKFIPYSYSSGARYCSPYRVLDVLLRCAHLPNWAQTIFILNCISYMKEHGQIEPGKPYPGLFAPYAPSTDVTFRILNNDTLISGQEPFPLALMIFEHLCFDVTEEQDLDMLHVMDGMSLGFGNDRKQSLRDQIKLARFPILWVELGDGMGQHLAGLANHWLEEQPKGDDGVKMDKD
ncbi:hypothetical protein INT43_005058 [Umbelopsis isabellina]|uniref:Uncharacterized protein n=1 Tax=Mortierella isabellina TaxID=91625 RepID=A0A8H7PGX5_MORIS|nr:hypothetical protein INT43_005058 [Umbelopsis isabellina]